MGSTRLGCLSAALIAFGSCASGAAGHPGFRHRAAHPTFRPRIAGAMGIIPLAGRQEIALGSNLPLVYHGGSVMRGTTIHTLFWAPQGFHFDGSPAAGVPGYEPLIQRFLTDLAAGSNDGQSFLSLAGQYGDSFGSAPPAISYTAADSINASDPYPARADQCASPSGVATCVTDLELRQEIDRVINTSAPNARGLNNLWLVFLPPDVDTCVAPGSCATNAYAGYHGLSNLGYGPTIYAVLPDPLIAAPPIPGADPAGNPEAESTIDVAAHETLESLTNPDGVGWMDPNGFEVGDKCENGPQFGPPLGFAPNGSPYNQLTSGHQYLIQTMWSNADAGCVQRSAATTSALPLARVRLTQFSSSLRGYIGSATPGVGVSVVLLRAGRIVARASARTRASGSWGPATLRHGRSLHGVGDDRDQIVIHYGRHGPPPDVISTGDGGNPFAAAGWTGWFDLDNGYAVASGSPAGSVLIGPCSQTGVLRVTVNGAETPSPIDLCDSETGQAMVPTSRIGPGTNLGMTSTDNRAVSPVNPDGALVRLSIPLGEPDSVSALGNPQLLFSPSGFPVCTAGLQVQAVTCTGLVPGARYSLTRRRANVTRHANADDNGSVRLAGFPGSRGLTGGDVLTLLNRARRRLTVLHVAHLRVDIVGRQTVIASGSCEPGNYYGAPLSAPPNSPAVGAGVGGSGRICPTGGRARGLPSADISQTDDRSGGQTRTRVPDIEGTTPVAGGIVYGSFTAFAQAGVPGPNGSVVMLGARVALTITPSSGGPAVFQAANVDTAGGASVGPLPAGTYAARWVLTDVNGDTRTLRTRFVAEPAG